MMQPNSTPSTPGTASQSPSLQRTDSARSQDSARKQDWWQQLYDRLARVERDYLVIQDLPQLHMPPDLAMLKPCHLGILYLLDE